MKLKIIIATVLRQMENILKQGFVKVYSEELKYEGEYVNNEKNEYGKIYKKMN